MANVVIALQRSSKVCNDKSNAAHAALPAIEQATNEEQPNTTSKTSLVDNL